MLLLVVLVPSSLHLAANTRTVTLLLVKATVDIPMFLVKATVDIPMFHATNPVDHWHGSTKVRDGRNRPVVNNNNNNSGDIQV
jgi:hypothetical protein